MENNRIVIDTNVFISAIIGQYSYPYKIFRELVGTGVFQIVVSNEILNEYKNVATREKFQRFKGFTERALAFIDMVEKLAIKVETDRKIEVIKDEFDNHFLAVASKANAFCIVTGNSRDFTFDEFERIKIYNPKEFYELFG